VSANPVREDDLNELFDAMWPSLENTILSLPALEPVRKVKRDPNEMIAEILELVRAEANRRTGEVKRPLPMVGISPTQVRAIVERVQSIQKFIGELLEHASHWSFADGVVTIYFPQAKSTFAGLMEGRDTKAKVRSCASDVLGSRVEINVAIDD
jgi:hypothetical protein